MPPTRAMIRKLFESLNLILQESRVIDCLLFCRGPKMEKSDPEDFKIEKFNQWFQINIRTFAHKSSKNVDAGWLYEQEQIKEMSSQALPMPPLRPDPQNFQKRNQGNYAIVNKVILLQGEHQNLIQTDPRAFLDYGLSANQMAQSYDLNHYMNKRRRNFNNLKYSSERPFRLNSMSNQRKEIMLFQNSGNNAEAQPLTMKLNLNTPQQNIKADRGFSQQSHNRYNTLTGRNEFTARPGLLSSVGDKNALSESLYRQKEQQSKTPSSKRVFLERDQEFQKQFYDLIKCMETDPKSKAMYWEKIS